MKDRKGSNVPPFPLSHIFTDIGEIKEKFVFKRVYIEQLDLSPRTYSASEGILLVRKNSSFSFLFMLFAKVTIFWRKIDSVCWNKIITPKIHFVI